MSHMPEEIRRVYAEADCLFTESEVEKAIDNMARAISYDLEDSNPIIFSIMNGGLVLTGKLVTQLGFPLEISYMHATRYRGETTGSNDLDWKALPPQAIAGRTVLIVDDIYDEGATLGHIIDFCREQGVKDIKIAVLLDKKHNRKARPDITPDYIGLECPDRYVFGYGMDYKNYWRNAPGIYAVKGL